MKKIFLLFATSVFSFSCVYSMKEVGDNVNKKEMTQEEAAVIFQKHWRTRLAQKEAAKLWTKKFCHSVVDSVLDGDINLEKIKNDLQNIPEQWQVEVVCNCLQILMKNFKIKNLIPQDILKDLFALFGILVKTYLNDYFYVFSLVKTELLIDGENKELADTLKSLMPDLTNILTTLKTLLDKDRKQEEEALFLENLKLLEPKIRLLLSKAATQQVKEHSDKFKNIIDALQSLSSMGVHINSEILGTFIKGFVDGLTGSIGSSIKERIIERRVIVQQPIVMHPVIVFSNQRH